MLIINNLLKISKSDSVGVIINTDAVGVRYCLRCRYGRCAAILEFFLHDF